MIIPFSRAVSEKFLILPQIERIAVQKPLKLIIDNYPEDQMEQIETPNHPQYPERGSRTLGFSKELWIEEDDFSENPPKGYRRLTLATEEKPQRLSDLDMLTLLKLLTLIVTKTARL